MSTIKIGVIGFGAGGGAVAAGLAEKGFEVTALEYELDIFQRQSSWLWGGQGRYHPWGGYNLNVRLANALAEEGAVFSKEAPETIVPVETRYYVPNWAAAEILDGWKSARLLDSQNS